MRMIPRTSAFFLGWCVTLGGTTALGSQALLSKSRFHSVDDFDTGLRSLVFYYRFYCG